jgi:electron transfer flavoprotein beta subunit
LRCLLAAFRCQHEVTTISPLTIAVLIKQVPDMNAVRIDRATNKIVLSPQLRLSSYDEYALEAALRLREARGGEVIAVAAGPATVRDVISRSLAMGADRAIHVEVADLATADTLATAHALADGVRPLGCDVVLAGQTSDDVETGQVGAQVAALLDMPLVSNIVALQLDDGGVLARRDMEDGYQTVRAPFPVVLLASTGLDEPRLPSLKGIMAAKKKPVDSVAACSSADKRLAWDEPYVPAKSISGTIVQDVPAAEAAAQLVAWLKEQKLI